MLPHHQKKQSIWQRIHIDLPLLVMILLVLIYSLVIFWSASGQNSEMLKRKGLQIGLSIGAMLLAAQISPRFYERLAPYGYVLGVLLLICVLLFGDTTKGAQRWLNLIYFRFQPSEMIKLILPLFVARLINRDICPPSSKTLIIALITIFIPTLLVALQPDLGTAILVSTSGLFCLFLAGINWWFIFYALLALAIFIPILWNFFMHDYQRERVLTLLNPEADPLGAGYHIIQSKISIGSGGLFGKGWLQGTQSQLEFLPERQTDFIFAVLAEELGLVGIGILLLLYLAIIHRCFHIALQAQTAFGRLVIGTFALIFFLYIFVNISMVSGIFPVVGVPLPMISYGGSSLLVLLTCFGMIMSMHTHRKMLSKYL